MGEPGKAKAALDFLLGFADWERGVGWNPRSSPDEAWKLGRTRALLDLAGAPDRRLRRLLIAGTNGKGSTGALLEAIVLAGGRRVGVYSQPHLHDYRERIRVGGQPIGEDALVRGVDRLRGLVEQLRARHPEAGEPTTFEVTTALAVLAFEEAGVELAVLEVGMGGRLDATNAVDAPLALVTPIGYDHTQVLGRTLGAIAGEKAGVFRPNGRALSALQRDAVARTLRAAARERGTALRFVEPLTSSGDAVGGKGQPVSFVYQGERHDAWLGLLGAYQRQNAALAVAAAEALAGQGLELDAGAVAAGLAAARWPGRLEWVAGRPDVLLDGAHNPPGAQALAISLGEVAPGRSVQLVFGCAADKDVAAVLRPLLPRARQVWATRAGDARATDAGQIAAVATQLGAAGTAMPSVAAALEAACGSASGDDLVVVTGSLRVVAEAREALGLAGDVIPSAARNLDRGVRDWRRS